MKLTTAVLIAILSGLPRSALGQCNPGALNECETALYDAATTWEGRARIARVRAENCEEKLAVRTSTAIAVITVTAPPVAPTEPGRIWPYLSAAGAGFILGILAAIGMVK